MLSFTSCRFKRSGQEQRFKINQKVLDKLLKLRYNKQAVAENSKHKFLDS